MKRLVIITLAALALLAQAMAPAPAAAKDWGLDLDLTYNSKYVWRGQNITDESVLQPSLSASFMGLSVGVWGNLELTDVNDEAGKFTEVDLSAEYAFSLGMVTIPVGVIYYYFPTPETDTTEVYAGVSLDVLLAPTLTIYYDVDAIEGAYISLGISHSFELTKGQGLSAGLDLGATIGWGSQKYNEGYWGVDRSAFNDLLLTAGVPLRIGEYLTVTPMASYSILLDNDLREATDKADNFYAGVSVTFSL